MMSALTDRDVYDSQLNIELRALATSLGMAVHIRTHPDWEILVDPQFLIRIHLHEIVFEIINFNLH